MKETIKIVSVKNAEHYIWGQNSDGWHLLKTDAVSIIQERMQPGSSEELHFHDKAQQFFYILSGEAVFEIDQKLMHLLAGDTVHIPPHITHKIYNDSDKDLHFVVISFPKSHGDRTNV